MIAFIMMAHNCEEFITQAVKSVMEVHPGSKLYVTDDGSTDSTLDVLKSLKDRYSGRIFISRHRRRRGAAHAFNTSLRRCMSDKDVTWIGRCDADDVILPGMREVIKRCGITSADVLYADHQELVKRNGEWVLGGRSTCPPPELITPGRLLRGRNLISGGAVVVRKPVYGTVGGWDIKLEGGWDLEWYIRAMLHGFRFDKVDTVAYALRKHPNSNFAESMRSGRWYRWRKQLEERTTYWEMAVNKLLKSLERV